MKYTLIDEKGRWYVFWDKDNYGEPMFSRDPVLAKRMAPQGAASAQRMLTAEGYTVTRQPASVADEMNG